MDPETVQAESEVHPLVAEFDSFKTRVEAEVGREDPSNQVTPLSRFEEHSQAFRDSLDQVLSGASVHDGQSKPQE